MRLKSSTGRALRVKLANIGLQFLCSLCILTLAVSAHEIGTSDGINIDAVINRFPNERLEYDLFYKGMNAATSQLWFEADSDYVAIIWQAKTKPLAGLLFKINNRYETIVNLNGRLVQANKTVHQKNISESWQIVYRWDDLVAHTEPNGDWPILPGCQNILSMLYDVRCQNLTHGDSIDYLIDVESQIWRLLGIVQDQLDSDGNLAEQDIVFSFQPAMPILKRAWKTDLLTNRLARQSSTLVFRFGPEPARLPLSIKFGDKSDRVEMRLKKQLLNGH